MATGNTVMHKGRFDFRRIKDGVYLAFDTQNKNALGGIVYTNDNRGRKWNAVDNKGGEQPRSFRTMSLAAESILAPKES